MAAVEGDYTKGWNIMFTVSETENIAYAASVEDVICAIISDPTLTKVVVADASLLAISANQACKAGRAIGVRIKFYRFPTSGAPIATDLKDIVAPARIFYH